MLQEEEERNIEGYSFWLCRITYFSRVILHRVSSFPNPTNAVGGSFILSLQRPSRARVRESHQAVGGFHQRSWWDFGKIRSRPFVGRV